MKKATKNKSKTKRSLRSKNWSEYRSLSDSISILNGDFSLNHQRFAYKSKGHQSVTVCLMAVLFSKLEKVQNWTTNTINTILTSGDSFYLKMLLKDNSTTMRANRMPLGLLEIIEHPIYLGPYKFIIDRDFTVVQDRVSEPHVLSDCLRAQQLSTLILAIQKYYFAIFKIDGFYCLFDAVDRDRYGNPTQPNCGSACVLRFANLDIFSKHFCCFLKIEKPVFKLFPIRIGRVSKLEPDNREIPINLPLLGGTAPSTKKKSKSKKSNSFCSDSTSLTGSLEVHPIEECSIIDRNSIVSGENVLCSLLNDKTFYTANEINCLQNREFGTVNYRILRATKYDRDSSSLSALVMLQCHRIKFWTSAILDRVLAIRIVNTHEPIECENKRFLIEAQTVQIVGRLLSKNENVFDFENGIEAFFKTHDMGLVEGPLNVAIWVENEKIFVWNRENCNDNGIRGSNNSDVDETACLLEFRQISDLVTIYFASIADANRNDFFMIRPINIQNYYFMPDNWNAFLGLKNKRYWILRGKEHKNTNEIANLETCAVYALVVYKYGENFADWTSETIDSIVRDCLKLHENVQDRVTCSYCDKEVHVDIERNVRCANFQESSGHHMKAETVLEKILVSFFGSYDLGYIAINSRATFCLFKSNEFFYLMNCFESNENGIKSTIGTCCVLRAQEVKQLVALLIPNIDLLDVRSFSLNAARIEFWQIDETDGIGIPNCPNYSIVEFENGLFREGFAILQASCSQFTPISKLAADQYAVTTCFCALAMSKLFPSLNWTSNILDEISKLGYELFSKRFDPNDCCLPSVKFEIGRNEFSIEPLVLQSIDGIFSLKLESEIESILESVDEESDMESESVEDCDRDESTEFIDNESNEDGSELNSLQIDDLEKSLSAFFENFSYFVLISEKWTVAFWTENGLIYQYNPRNCNEFGYEPNESETGRSCLMLFANFDRLRQFLQVPIAANENLTFKLIPIDIQMNLRPIEKNLEQWHRFNSVPSPVGDENMWILRGSVSRNDEMFPEHNRGNQSFFDCLICLCFASTCSVGEFDTSTIDLILFYGDRLFSVKESFAETIEQRADCETIVSKVIKSFSLKHLKVHCNIKRNIVTGDLKANETNDVLNLKRAIESIAVNQPEKLLLIVHLKNDHFAIFKLSDCYYLFDSDSCSPAGLRTTFGKAALTRHSRLETLQHLLIENMRNFDGSDQFSIDLIELDLKEELNFYREVLREFSLAEITALKTNASLELFALHATLSQDSDCFRRLEHSACAANCVSVFAMQQFRKTSTWTERILDEVLLFADRELYERSRMRQEDGENGSGEVGDHKLPLECLINDFDFQSHHVHFDLLNDFKMIRIWRKTVIPILYMLEEFFQKGFRYGAFKCSLLFAIWKEELYYLFDPHAKHKLNEELAQYLGMPTCAYLLGFKTIQALAEFLLVTIPDSVQNGTEFELLPLEFKITYPKVSAETTRIPVTDCNFIEIDSELAISILHGSLSLYADKYDLESRGCQIYTVSVMASVISILRNPRTWTSDVIDDILDIGMTLYEMIKSRNVQQSNDGDKMLLGFESIVRSLKNCDRICELIQKQGTVREIPENTVIEIFKARLQNDLTFEDLVSYLNEWFVNESHAIIEKKITYTRPESTVRTELIGSEDSLVAKEPKNHETGSEQEFKLELRNETDDLEKELEPQSESEKVEQQTQRNNEIVQIFCITIVKNSQEFYLFDPYCRDSHGNAIEVGRACVLKCEKLPQLLEKFLINTYRSNEFESFAETITYSIFTTDLKNL